jgi:hypothetical protein
MKKKGLVVLLAVLLLCVSAAGAGAELRMDFNIPWLLAGGLQLAAIPGASGLGTSADISNYHFIIPDFELSWQFGGAPLRGGVGVRAYSLLIETLGFPQAYIECDLDPIVLRAALGGGAFFMLGLYSDFVINSDTLQVLIPDISAAWKVTDWFQLGAGFLALAPLGDLNNFGWVGYVNARFVLTFKE